MVDNTFTRTSPCMDDTVWERDMFGDVVQNEEGEPRKVQRVLISVCPRQLHVHMMKDKEEGGYPPAREGEHGMPRYLMSTIVMYMPNLVT